MQDTNLRVKNVKSLLHVKPDEECVRVKITPDVASYILNTCNTTNRPIRRNELSKLERYLKSDQWKFVSDAISFADDGTLTNGQHRLTACVKTGVPIDVLVAFGVERSSAIDTGAKRSFSDNLKICDNCDERIKYDDELHRIFMTAYQYRNGYQQVVTLTPDDLTELMNKYAEDLVNCKNNGLFAKINTKGCNSTVIKSALFLAYMNGVSMNILLRIVAILKTGVAESNKDTPIIGLRDKLFPLIGGGRETSNLRFNYTQHCIKKCEKGNISKSLSSDKAYYTYSF